MSESLFGFDRSEKTQQVDKHDTMGELRLVVETVDFSAVLRNSSKRKDVVEIQIQSSVDVVDERFNVLTRTLVEWNDNQGRSAAPKLLVNGLVVFDRCAAIPRGCNDDVCTAREETFQNFDADRALTDTRQESVFVLERGPRRCDLS